jgi:hypothetical protein
MPAISVWEGVYQYQLVVKTCCKLIPGKQLVLYLVADVSAELLHYHRDLRPFNSDVGLNPPKLPGPTPFPIKHPLM